MAHSAQSVQSDIIASLLQQPFNTRSKEEQYRIVRLGRPMPLIDVFLKSDKNGKSGLTNTRNVHDYNMSVYEHYQWLAGNKDTNKLHCWPCLLMYKVNENNIWVQGAHLDLASLSAAAESHHNNEKHLDNMCAITELVEELNDILLAKFRRNFPQFNQKAILNRALLNKLVEVGILVYMFDLSVEYLATDWLTAEKFQGLFDILVAGNEDLIKHCQDMKSNFIQMIRTFFLDFLDCLQDTIQVMGYLDIVQCSPQPLCSIQLDSISDVDAGKSLLTSIMVSYVNKDGVLQQHFFGFESNPARSAATVSRIVEVAMVRYRQNTVSQSYDGACVFVDELMSLKKKIQITAPSAVLVPSIDHPLNQVLMQGVFNVRGVQSFVSTIQDLVQNPKQLKVLSQLKNGGVASVAEMKWSIDSKFLSFLLNERASFISAFDQPPNNVGLSPDMCVAIKHLVNNLEDLDFMFLLFAFNDILKITDDLADIVGLHLSDGNKCTNAVKCSITKLKLLKSENKAREYIDEAKKCLSAENAKANPSSLVTLFDLIIENIVLQIKSRFGDIQQFEFLQLADSKKFEKYYETFPEGALISLNKLYGKHFDIKRLEKELKSFIYRNPCFRSLSAVDIIKLIREMGLKDTISQAYKLFCLVATLPITAAEERNCFKQIQSFMNYAKKHSSEKYLNHRSLPVTGLTSVLFKHNQVVIEKQLVLQLFAKEGFRGDIAQQYIAMKKQMGIHFDCAQ